MMKNVAIVMSIVVSYVTVAHAMTHAIAVMTQVNNNL
jgi:hypothetical protein